jgi:chromosome segregation ATPase
MTVPIYIGIAAVLFIVGIIFILKGSSSDDETAVPISSIGEIREFKETLVPTEKSEPKEVVEPGPEVDTQQSQGNQFMEENHQLRKEILDEKQRYEELEKRLESLKNELDQAKDQREDSIKDLKDENEKIKLEKEQLSSNTQLIEDLKEKTGLLEKQYEENQKQQDEMKTMIAQLKSEKDDLVAQIKVKEDQVDDQIKAQAVAASKMEFETLGNKLMGSISAIEELKRENKDLQQANLDLKEAFKKTGELNTQLMKKEKMMQYELTKNRAQALGLEKICADFRTRIETMAGTAMTEK